METLRALIPDFAKDIRLNLSSMFTADDGMGLTQRQLNGIALTSAFSTRNDPVIAAANGEAKALLSDSEIAACKIASTMMAMTNVYYRAIHFAADEGLTNMPARLRMNSLAQHGAEKLDFELFSLAASAINGCEKCISAHIASARKSDASDEAIQATLRIAAVIAAAAQALTLSELS